MRLRILVVITLLTCGVLSVAAQATQTPDYAATATSIIQQATRTAEAMQNQPTSMPAADDFQLTSTRLVVDATRTAEAFTGQTAVPITNTPLGDISAQLTATELVRLATPQTDSQNEGGSGDNSLSLAGILVAIVGAILAAIGGLFGIGRNKSSD